MKVPKDKEGHYQGGPITVEVTERNTKLDIGACSASLQKLIAIFTLLFQLTYVQRRHQQRIFLMDELEAHLHERVTGKLFKLLSTRCHDANIQLIVTTNSHSIITQSNSDIELLYLTPNGPNPINSIDNKEALYSVLNALSQMKTNKRIVVVDGENDVAFYQKFTKLDDHFELIQLSNTVIMDNNHVQAILKQITDKSPIFLKNSEMYSLSPYLSETEKVLEEKYDSPFFFTKLPCVESYLLLNQLLLNPPNKEKRNQLLQVLHFADHALYFIDSYRQQHMSFGISIRPPVQQSQLTESMIENQMNTNTSVNDNDLIIPTESNQLEEPIDIWNEKTKILFEIANNNTELDHHEFWTSFVKLVDGRKFFKNTEKVIESAERLHPHVEEILQQTVNAILKL